MKRYIKSAVKDFGEETYSTQHDIIANPNAPRQLLEQLSSNPNFKAEVARNPSTSATILRRLANEAAAPGSLGQGEGIRDALACNPNTPSDVLLVVARNSDAWTHRRLINHPNANREVLKYIAKADCGSKETRKLAREKLKTMN